MTTLPGLTRRSASRLPLLGALALVLLGFLAVLASGARPALGADPTMSPFVPGRHVYDYGSVLSARSATTAEALAAHIEGAGAGRVVLYTAPDTGAMPDGTAIAQSWNVDGLLLTAQSDFGQLKLGPALEAKLDSHQVDFVSGNSSPGPQTAESWLLSTLARVDAFVSGTHVFDGTGILDATGRQKAETAAKDLGDQIGANVYIDIAIGGNDPSTAAFFNGAGMSSDLGKSIVVALAVSDGRIGGYIDYSGDLSGSYTTSSPWSYNTLANESAPNGDVQAALLAAIGAVQKPPLIPPEAIPWIIFAVVIVIFSITAPFLWGPWLIRKLAGVSGPIKNGLPGDAVIQSISDTGMTISMPSVGPEAPEYKFVLQVTAAGGGAPYQVEVKAIVPRLFVPMVVPGASIGVLIDPANPQKVTLDFSRVGTRATPGSGAGGLNITPAGPGGYAMAFDAAGQPSGADVAALVGGVRSGAVRQIKGSAAQLLATGTHGTAVITTAQPLGKTVRDIDPSAAADRLDDPMWLFTVEVSLAGQAPFPAVFGHRVPLDKVAWVAPGVKLAVAVDESHKNEDVAIDWDKSPIG